MRRPQETQSDGRREDHSARVGSLNRIDSPSFLLFDYFSFGFLFQTPSERFGREVDFVQTI